MVKRLLNWRSSFLFRDLLSRISVVIGITTLSFITAFILYQNKILKGSLMEEGRALTHMAANNLRLGVFSGNTAMVDNAGAVMFRYKRLEGVAVYDGEGKLLRALEKANGKIQEARPEEAEKERRAVDECSRRGNDVCQYMDRQFLFYSPVTASAQMANGMGLYLNSEDEQKERVIGSVVMRFDYRRELEGQRSLIIFSGIWFAMAIVAVAFVVAIPLMGQVVKPIKELTEAVGEIGARGLPEGAPGLAVNRHDEIGKLTEAFNAMLEALRQKEVERRRYETELAESQKMESIGILSGGLAHDFNNLLTAVMSHAQVIVRGLEKDNPLVSNVVEIQRCADHVAGITRNLLTFSSKSGVSAAPLNIVEVAYGMFPLLRALIPENIRMRVDNNSEEVIVEADRAQLQQSIMNLALNARDAMEGGGELVIAVSKEAQGDYKVPYAALSVSDTGAGMDDETCNRIFEPFFTTKELGQGTGLGLAMVYGVVKGCGGHIEVQSREGEGTKITLYFPVKEAKLDVESGMLPGNTAGTETVLLVEDNEMVRDIVSKVMRTKGYGVITAKDGDDGIKQFNSYADRIDIVVCDIVMPGKGGAEVYQVVKAKTPSMRFLFMSGYSPSEKTLQDVAQGADFIAKPVSADTLIAKIREMVDGGAKVR